MDQLKLKRKGNLFVFTGPSGVGKGTVLKKTIENIPGIRYSISATTRDKRPGEKDAVHYFFKTQDEFKKCIEENKFLEWAQFAGNYYGTPKDPVLASLDKGEDVLLEIEAQGAMQVLENCNDAIMIFLRPPSMEELEARLRGRGTETEEQIQKRLAKAKAEMDQIDKFHYVIVNDDLDKAAEELKKTILSKRSAVL